MENNAITRRLQILEAHWATFRIMPNISVCRWFVKQDELSMIDTFFQANAHQDSTTPDIFLKFEAPFDNAETYSQALSAELALLIELDKPLLEEQDVAVNWQPQHKTEVKNVALGFLKDFFSFSKTWDLDPKQDLFVAFLSPKQITNPTQWKKWWSDVTALNIPPNIRLMVTDTEGYEVLDKVAAQNMQTMHSIRPDLKMTNAVRELMNEKGDQNDNGTHFKKAFFELSQTVQLKDATAVNQAAEKAMGLARLMGYPHLEIAVLSLAASGFSNAGKLDRAIQTLDAASNIAKKSEDKPLVKEMPELKTDLPGGNLYQQLNVQVLFAKAEAYITAPTPQYENAFSCYQQAEGILQQQLFAKGKPAEEAPNWSNGGIINIHLLESIRMMGHCSEMLGRNQQALAAYVKAVSVAEKMPLEMRLNSTLSYTGQALANICKKLGMKNEYITAVKKMRGLLWEDWPKPQP